MTLSDDDDTKIKSVGSNQMALLFSHIEYGGDLQKSWRRGIPDSIQYRCIRKN